MEGKYVVSIYTDLSEVETAWEDRYFSTEEEAREFYDKIYSAVQYYPKLGGVFEIDSDRFVNVSHVVSVHFEKRLV